MTSPCGEDYAVGCYHGDVALIRFIQQGDVAYPNVTRCNVT